MSNEKKENPSLPMQSGHDLDQGEALDQSDKDLSQGHWISGSSNREGGYDAHPHAGDHGDAPVVANCTG